MRVQSRLIAYLVIGIAAVSMAAAYADDEVKVPFVGCPSDGQLGPQPPSPGTAQVIHINFKLPGPIAYYDGVFAPAGWHCLELAGSSGVTIIVSAKPVTKYKVIPDSFGSPVIELSEYSGDTSGRFSVATYGHMLFPDLTKDFVKSVEDEGIESKADIEVPKSTTDHLTYLNPKLVAFETPANLEGLGTRSYVKAGLAPITGLVALSDDDDGVSISILRIAMGIKDDAWNRALIMLNTPCLTGSSCQNSNSDISD